MGIDELHECVTNISTRADQADLETQETTGSTIWSKEQTGGASQRVGQQLWRETDRQHFGLWPFFKIGVDHKT